MSAERATDDEFLAVIDAYLIDHPSPPSVGSWRERIARLVQMVRERDAEIATAKAVERERIAKAIEGQVHIIPGDDFIQGIDEGLTLAARIARRSPTGDNT